MRNTVAGAADERDEYAEARHALGDGERSQHDASAQSAATPPEACERCVRCEDVTELDALARLKSR